MSVPCTELALYKRKIGRNKNSLILCNSLTPGCGCGCVCLCVFSSIYFRNRFDNNNNKKKRHNFDETLSHPCFVNKRACPLNGNIISCRVFVEILGRKRLVKENPFFSAVPCSNS